MNYKVMYPISIEYSDLITELKDLILERIENHSIDDTQRKENYKHPFSLDCVFSEPRHQIEHSYDVGRLEMARRASADIEYLIAYEKETEESDV